MLVESPERLGYLLKDRVADVGEFVATLRRVVAAVPRSIRRWCPGSWPHPADDGPLRTLTPREREVLELVAEGLSNQAIAERLGIARGSTEKYVSSIFTKLRLPDTGGEYRRVLAVLRLLRT